MAYLKTFVLLWGTPLLVSGERVTADFRVDHEQEHRLSEPWRSVIDSESQMPGLLDNVPDRTLLFPRHTDSGWYDPHLHESGAVNLYGLFMMLDAAQPVMQELFATTAWQGALQTDLWQERAEYAHSKQANEEYLYSILSRGMFHCDASEALAADAPQVCRLIYRYRKKLIELGAQALIASVPKLLSNTLSMRRLANGTGTMFPLVKCLQDTTGSSDESDMQRIRIMSHILTANPLLDFESSYIARGLYMKSRGKVVADFFRNTITELIDSDTAYAQFSTPIKKVPTNFSTEASGGASTHLYASPVRKQNVQLGWMPMFLGTVLACSNDGHVVQWKAVPAPHGGFRADKVVSEIDCDNFEEDRYMGFDVAMAKLRQGPYLHGVDFASPETFAMNADGESNPHGAMARFLKVCETMLDIAKESGVNDKGIPKRRMVVHVHVGEGFPSFDKSTIYITGEQEPAYTPFPAGEPVSPHEIREAWQSFSDKKFGMIPAKYTDLCTKANLPHVFDARGWAPIHTLGAGEERSCAARYNAADVAKMGSAAFNAGAQVNGGTRCYPGEPLHYEGGRQNIDALLQMVRHVHETLDGEGFNDYIRIQFGHVTHTTVAQARIMKDLRVMADADLSSNLATGALHWAGEASSALFTSFGDQNTYAHTGRQAIMAPDSGVAEVFQRHGLLKLLLAGISVTLGTDSIGVEHSGFQQDYHVADAVIQKYLTEGPGCNDKLKAGQTASPLCAEIGQLWGIFGDTGVRVTDLLQNQHEQWEWIQAAEGSADMAAGTPGL